MRRAIQATFVFSLLLFARQSYADPVAVGDLLHFQGTDSNIWGGAFDVDNAFNGVGVDFQSFCLQINQDIDYDHQFVVGSITDSADDNGGPDPISTETAWIFSSYRHGALSMFTNDEIQAAIWILEDEWTLADGVHVFGAAVIGDPDALIALAQANVNAGWVNNSVQVLNMFTLDGERAQDQLTLSEVPEPGTMLLVGGGAAALLRRRRNKRLNNA